MNTIRFSPNFKNFLTLLKIKRVDYLLVGGYAVQYYGYPRTTRDLDIWTAIHPLNAMKMVDVFQNFGAGMSQITADPFQHENRIIRIEVPPLNVEILNPIIGQKPESILQFRGNQTDQIEILTVQSGVKFESCFPERVVDILEGVDVNIISLVHLQAIKRAGSGSKDSDDLAHLT